MDSGPIPAESGGIRSFLQESVGHQKVVHKRLIEAAVVVINNLLQYTYLKWYYTKVIQPTEKSKRDL